MARPPFNLNAPYRFVFNFTHEDLLANDQDGIVKWFLFEDLTEESLNRLLLDIHDEDPGNFLSFSEDMEWSENAGKGYGVHDYSTTGYNELAGFGSYEIEPDKVDEVINKWREFFIREGFSCGPIETTYFTEYRGRFGKEF